MANAQSLTQMLYEMASRNDAETRRILDDVILLAAFSNPDGLELVADWYNREPNPSKRSMANLPVLYQKYIGHDNNRESLLMNMPESEAIGRELYREWFPQIMYNQHQSGPAGTVLFIGQMRDPSNPFFDPLMAPSMELVSAAIHTRFVAEGKPGATNRSFASYQNWWNGGVRSTACFHNQIGILSEISGSPTPIEIAFVPKNLVATNDNPFPVAAAGVALPAGDRLPADGRSRHPRHRRGAPRELPVQHLPDGKERHRQGKPRHVDVHGEEGRRGRRRRWRRTRSPPGAAERRSSTTRRCATRPRATPRGYVLPADQPDFLTATKFVNALIKNGVTVHRATAPFQRRQARTTRPAPSS